MDIARDISIGEKVESEIDVFIDRRHEKRVRTEGDREREELYEAYVRAYNAQRAQERRAEWASFHRSQAERHRATLNDLVAHHLDAAERLEHEESA